MPIIAPAAPATDRRGPQHHAESTPPGGPALTALPAAILDEAAGWLVQWQSGAMREADHAALLRWRERSPDHEAAWRRAEAMLATFQQVPAGLGRATLARRPTGRRRQVLGAGLLLLAAPAAWLGWRQDAWQTVTADLRTGTGERRSVSLADGTQVDLNAQTALDVRYTPTLRELVLIAGDILVDTRPDSAVPPRPFLVQTPHGSVRALGTRFSVNERGQHTRVEVTQGAVVLQPTAGGTPVTVTAGDQAVMDTGAVSLPRPHGGAIATWRDGMLLARSMPLGDVITALAAYQRGVLRCDPEVAHLVVSGALPLDDVSASLRLLTQTLPVEVVRTTPWWVTVRARRAPAG